MKEILAKAKELESLMRDSEHFKEGVNHEIFLGYEELVDAIGYIADKEA